MSEEAQGAPKHGHPRGPIKARSLGSVGVLRGKTRTGIKRHPNHPNRLPDRSKKT